MNVARILAITILLIGWILAIVMIHRAHNKRLRDIDRRHDEAIKKINDNYTLQMEEIKKKEQALKGKVRKRFGNA